MPLLQLALAGFFFVFIFIVSLMFALVMHGDMPAAPLLDVLQKSLILIGGLVTQGVSIVIHRFLPQSASPVADLPLIDPTTEPK